MSSHQNSGSLSAVGTCGPQLGGRPATGLAGWLRLAYPPAGQRRQQAADRAHLGYARQFPDHARISWRQPRRFDTGPGLAQTSARAPEATASSWRFRLTGSPSAVSAGRGASFGGLGFGGGAGRGSHDWGFLLCDSADRMGRTG